MITLLEIDELSVLAAKAVPGPWKIATGQAGNGWCVVGAHEKPQGGSGYYMSNQRIFDDGSSDGEYCERADEGSRDFIVTLVNVYPDMVSHIKDLRGLLTEQNAELKVLRAADVASDRNQKLHAERAMTIDLDELERLEKAASEAPQRLNTSQSGDCVSSYEHADVYRAKVAALEALPALIAELRQCRHDGESKNCSDHGCVFGKPSGMGTNGGCNCLGGVRDWEDRRALRFKLTALRDELRELRAFKAQVEDVKRRKSLFCPDRELAVRLGDLP